MVAKTKPPKCEREEFGPIPTRPIERTGWGVAIRRNDGTEFLACASQGLLPVVWAKQQRKYAAAHKRDLAAHDFKCRVVPVVFTDPRIEEAP